MLALTCVLLLAGLIQGLVSSQYNDRELETMKQATIQQAKSEIIILANEIVINVSMITQTADGNASLLLADLTNEINKDIAKAQTQIAQIVSSYQANFSKRADEILAEASVMYTKVQSKLINSSIQLEKEIGRILNKTELVINKYLNVSNSKNSTDRNTETESSTILSTK